MYADVESYACRINQHRGRLGQKRTMGDYNFERVKEFKYLGTMITLNTDITTEEINCRLKAGNRCLYVVQDLLQYMKNVPSVSKENTLENIWPSVNTTIGRYRIHTEELEDLHA